MSVVYLALTYLLSKVGKIKPATRAKAIEIINAAQAAGHRVRFVWGMGSSDEHATGNALDIMVFDQAAGDFIRNYVWENRARLRLRHVIWAQHITSTVVQPGVRRKMADRGNVTENHFDHNHIWFLDDAPYVPPAAPPAAPTRKSNTQIAAEVWAGKWGNGADRARRLTEAGYSADAIQELVNRGVGNAGSLVAPVPARKSNAQLADEVIAGHWGNGAERVHRLSAAGYDANAVQAVVNQKVAPAPVQKSISTLASEVIAGQWGNGPNRKSRLTSAGYDYRAVQAEVNRRL